MRKSPHVFSKALRQAQASRSPIGIHTDSLETYAIAYVLAVGRDGYVAEWIDEGKTMVVEFAHLQDISMIRTMGPTISAQERFFRSAGNEASEDVFEPTLVGFLTKMKETGQITTLVDIDEEVHMGRVLAVDTDSVLLELLEPSGLPAGFEFANLSIFRSAQCGGRAHTKAALGETLGSAFGAEGVRDRSEALDML